MTNSGFSSIRDEKMSNFDEFRGDFDEFGGKSERMREKKT